MKKQVYLMPTQISTEEKSIGFPEDTSFWQPLWMKFSAQATTIEIHCWSAEQTVRSQLRRWMQEIGEVPGTETIAFKAALTEELIDWLATQSYDSRGGLKWFSIFLFDASEQQVASIEHYGGEIIFDAKDDWEVDEVKSYFKGELIVHVSE